MSDSVHPAWALHVRTGRRIAAALQRSGLVILPPVDIMPPEGRGSTERPFLPFWESIPGPSREPTPLTLPTLSVSIELLCVEFFAVKIYIFFLQLNQPTNKEKIYHFDSKRK